jgi:hypothetical protein
VSQLGERPWEDYQAFAQRDLSEYEITYLFVDGIAEVLRIFIDPRRARRDSNSAPRNVERT